MYKHKTKDNSCHGDHTDNIRKTVKEVVHDTVYSDKPESPDVDSKCSFTKVFFPEKANRKHTLLL